MEKEIQTPVPDRFFLVSITQGNGMYYELPMIGGFPNRKKIAEIVGVRCFTVVNIMEFGQKDWEEYRR